MAPVFGTYRPRQRRILEGVERVMISREITKIQQRLTDENLSNIKAVILYGSWAKGTAREDSDVDLLAVYRRKDKRARDFIDELIKSISMGRDFTVVHVLLRDFVEEKWPVYTAAKMEGKVVFGDVDLSISERSPLIRYSGFFKKSRKFESHKIEMAQKMLSNGVSNSVVDYCFIASKHAIQAALAMRGRGYSSKMGVLMPLAKKCFGGKVSLKFQKLFGIYKRSEKISCDITKKDAGSAVLCAREIIKVYDLPVGE